MMKRVIKLLGSEFTYSHKAPWLVRRREKILTPKEITQKWSSSQDGQQMHPCMQDSVHRSRASHRNTYSTTISSDEPTHGDEQWQDLSSLNDNTSFD